VNVRFGALLPSGSRIFLSAYDADNRASLWTIDRGLECTGDCDEDGVVSVADVVSTVKVALGLGQLDACPLIDANSDLRVSIDEVVASVYSLLHDCRREAS
jgi:hypothetical protein